MNFTPPEHPVARSAVYGLSAGASTVVFWILMSVFSFTGSIFINLLLVLALVGGIVAWIKLLQWMAEQIYQIPFQLRYILIGLAAGYLFSFPLLLALPAPVWLCNLLGFSLGSAAVAYYFSR